MISAGTKVHVEVRGQVLPAVVVFHHFASTGIYDLYTLRVAKYGPGEQGWLISEYGPVSSCKLAKRETHVPALDLEPKKRYDLMPIPAWVQQLHR